MPEFSVLCKDPPKKRCYACGAEVPVDDEVCSECGYYESGYDLGEQPDDAENVDEDIDISEALEELPAAYRRRVQSLADLLRLALPDNARVYGWWDRDCRDMCAAWFGSRGWFATITRTGENGDGVWGPDTDALVKGALARMVGPFSSVQDLVLSVRYDEFGKLGGMPSAEAGVIVWGLLRLLNEQDLVTVRQQVKIRSTQVVGRKRNPSLELP